MDDVFDRADEGAPCSSILQSRQARDGRPPWGGDPVFESRRRLRDILHQHRATQKSLPGEGASLVARQACIHGALFDSLECHGQKAAHGRRYQRIKRGQGSAP